MVVVLLFFYRSTLGYKPVLSGSNDLELAIVLVYKLIIAEFVLPYSTPSSPVCTFDNFCTTLLSLDPVLFSNFVLLGDFNINFYNPNHPLYSKTDSFHVFFLPDSGCISAYLLWPLWRLTD